MNRRSSTYQGRKASFFIDLQWDSNLLEFDREICRLQREMLELQNMTKVREPEHQAKLQELNSLKQAKLNSLKKALNGMTP